MALPRDKHLSIRKIYPPANECIYCGAKDVPLTDEHPVPNGMNSNHILPRACCKPCQKIINEEFEQFCLRTVLSNLRAILGFKSSRKRKPVRHSIVIETHEGERKRIYLDAEDLPAVFALPMFPVPFFMTGQQPSANYRAPMWKYRGAWLEIFAKKYGARAFFPESTTPRQLARFIAKMAHAQAWALYGPVFEPLLPPIILGEEKLFVEYVGGVSFSFIEEKESCIGFHCWRKPYSGDSYLVARIRPFSEFAGSPIYTAIVGRLLVPWPLPKR